MSLGSTLPGGWSAGEVTLDALVEGLAELECYPDFDPSFDTIADFSNACLVVSSDDLLRFQAAVAKRGWTDVGRWAMVAPRDLEFGIGRQAQALWQLENSMVFRDLASAIQWLSSKRSRCRVG